MRTFTIVVAALILIGPLRLSAAEEDVLATLRKGHPRLLVLDDDIARVKTQIASDQTAKRYFDQLTTAAEKVIKEPVAERVLIGPRLLQVSRHVLDRVTLLGGLYRLTGDRRYFERARDEMLAAAAFEDWHPPHFLDTAEMTNAMALGYDWLYDQLSPAERATIKTAIVEKGLKPGLTIYEKKNGWVTSTFNWNQVCNGGMTAGALAVADQDPDIARQIITAARASIPRAMANFSDGGWAEGPGYWDYATRYILYYAQSLRTALGTDFGCLESPGFAEAGMFRIYTTSPTGETFNFADGGSRLGTASQMLYFAGVFDRPAYAAHERLIAVERSRPDPFHLLFFNSAGSMADIEKLPTAAIFRRINVATMRSAWNDANAAFVGFKAGDNKANHGHADLGSFVYDVDGMRWAMDLGSDDYNLPSYFGNLRYTYYRNRTESHNTLTIGNENQDTKAEAPMIAFSADPKQPFAVANLSPAYAPHARRVQRGVKLIGRQLLVQDEVDADEPIEIRWNLLTEAKPQIDGSVATLSRGDKELIATIIEPAGAGFELLSANPPPPQKQQPNVVNLTIRQPQKAKTLRLVVLLTPKSEGAAKVDIASLEKWILSSARESAIPAH